MREKIAQILIFDIKKEALENIIKQSGGIMNSAKFLSGLENFSNLMNADFGGKAAGYSAIEKQGLEMLCEIIDNEEEYFIDEYDNYCILGSEWFYFSDILYVAEKYFGNTEYDFVAMGTNSWDVLVSAIYEKGKLSAKLVVGSYEDIYLRKDNYNLDAFDKFFNQPSGSFKKLKAERNILKARKMFELLTSIKLENSHYEEDD